MRGLRTTTAVLLALAAQSHASWAQRAGDNAVTAAQDAFGTSVGNENIGLYSGNNARGFSPQEAGNLRIEGMYFDQQVNLGNRLLRGSTIRVGLSAQSYPFPAPTGIADYQLRLPGQENVVSVVGTYISDGTYRLEVDSQWRLVPEKLGLTLGGSAAHDVFPAANTSRTWNAGVIFRWQPTENSEIIPFWAREEKTDWESLTYRWFTAGPFLPPKIKRGLYTSQDWADFTEYDSNFGVLGRINTGNWTFRTGAFRSIINRPAGFISLLRDIQPDASATLSITANPPLVNASNSGEVRAAHVLTDGPRQYTIHLMLRGRETNRQFGGGATHVFGPVNLAVNRQFAKPNFVPGPISHDQARQGTAGVAYQGLWPEVGEFSVGVQKTYLKRDLTQPNLPFFTSSSSEWLYNATMAAYPTRDLAAYASYTRGLEESGVAPESAANYGQSQPPSLTRQIDAGIRYALTSQLRLVAGVFEVSKPYLNRNIANIFTTVGAVKNRGFEFSLSGPLAPGLRAVAGAVLMRQRVSGLTVDQGLIGRVPAGEVPRTLRLNLQYGPTHWKGFSIDGQVVNNGAPFANRLNTYKIPTSTTFDLGARYQFTLHDVPASIRVQMTNVTNVYSFNMQGGSEQFIPSPPRRVSARLTADF